MSSAPLFPFLEQLLQGETVVWKKLGEVAAFYSGLSGKNKHDFEEGNAHFITYKNIFENLSVNQDILECVRIEEGEKQNSIEYGDVLFTGSSESAEEVAMSCVVTFHPERDIYLNSFSFGIRFHEGIDILPAFSKYLFRSFPLRKQIVKTANGVTRYNVSKSSFAKILIPLPSVRVQRRIVEILDKFTNLEAELKAELSLRNKQYAFYRNKLLDFRNPPPNALNVRWMKLGEVAEIGTGKSNRQDETENGEYPFYVRSQKVLRSSSFQFDETAIIIPGEGGIGEIFHFVEGKYALHQRAYRIKLNNASEICTRFLYYYMRKEFGSFILKRSVGATATSIRKPMIENFPIPIPPLAEQERIVAILDRFDTLTNSIAEGLPREIELRHQQYVFYRDALLNFPK